MYTVGRNGRQNENVLIPTKKESYSLRHDFQASHSIHVQWMYVSCGLF
jgi:hypothetical protein